MRQRSSARGPGNAGAPAADGGTYLGLFLVALATLMFELLLTRIFSVTLSYHFAFAVISVAMFGMTSGAILVYLRPARFTAERAGRDMTLGAAWFSLTSAGAVALHVTWPSLSGGASESLWSLIPSYLMMAVPFTFSGLCMCLALTKHPQQVSKLYAADLAGAAAGCLALVLALEILDGPTCALLVAAIAALSAASFSWRAQGASVRKPTAILATAAACAAAGHAVLVWTGAPLLRVSYAHGRQETSVLYEKWNSFSRITVEGDPDARWKPSGWGLSPAFHADRPVRELNLWIDSAAGTTLTGFDGTIDGLEHLRHDIVNLANHIRPDADLLVIGAGGGRDVLSALAFGQKSVVAVEINEDILDAVTRRFGDFTGHLDRLPGVTFVNDEARSYAARQRRRFDLIQISLIDTWAATTAGAFVLTENALYTVEAWEILMRRLTPRGILTCSRWYFRDRPAEVYRLTSLAGAALRRLGVAHPRDHIVVARLMQSTSGDEHPDGVGTILVSREPFSAADLATLAQVSARMKFDVVLSPSRALDETFSRLTSESAPALLARYPLDISPPTDDRPFFFHTLRLGDALRLGWDGLPHEGANRINLRAVAVLGGLLGLVIALTLACVILPLMVAGRSAPSREELPLLVYFASIGMGFMLVEISMMQRLVIFLGHPSYALSVVLFTLLLSSGAGSFLSGRIAPSGGAARAIGPALATLTISLALLGWGTPLLVRALEAQPTPARIAVSAGILSIAGLLMGLPFPLGMRASPERLAPWLWGVNGATSVCASVVAVAIALTWGIGAAHATGCAFYVLALAAGLLALRGRAGRTPAPSA